MDLQIWFNGGSFSPDSRYLYISTSTKLYQFDTNSDDIIASRKLVKDLDECDAPLGAGSLNLHKLGPDGKIYISSPGSHRFLSVINEPNCEASNCGFVPWQIALLGKNFGGLPNLPYFDSESNSCITTNEDSIIHGSESVVFPNPAEDVIYIQIAYEELNQNISIRVYDLKGNIIQSKGERHVKLEDRKFGIPLSNMSNGMYLLEIKNLDSKKIRNHRFIVAK